MSERWVLVTGGALRLGREFCLAFARAGWNVVCHYRHSAEAAQQTCAELRALGRQTHALQGGLGHADAAARLFDDVLAAIGRAPDALVNNASQFEPDSDPDTHLTPGLLTGLLQLNLVVPLQLAGLLASARAARGQGGDACAIHVLDQKVFNLNPDYFSYTVTKLALEARGAPLRRYTIVDVSGALRERQRQRLADWAPRVAWADALPEALRGVVIGNEVLDAMPVPLLARIDGVWHERGVALAGAADEADPHFTWADRPTALRPPVEIEGAHDYLTEIHPQQRAFIATLAETLVRGGAGAAFFIDYGFPEAEYWHPQRDAGTLLCHRAHQHDDDPLSDVGLRTSPRTSTSPAWR